jgi:acyl-CoA thioester hydrolase
MTQFLNGSICRAALSLSRDPDHTRPHWTLCPMPVYRLQRRLSHADVDFLGELKVTALLGLLEQAAVEASTAAGFDAAWYTGAQRIWIIRRTDLRRAVPVGGTDLVEVETQVIDFRRVRSLRRYTVRRDALVVAEATTDWVYCDLTSGRPARIPEAMQQAFLDGTPSTVLPRAAPLPDGAAGAAVEFEVTVHPSHLDHVTHVNNAVYAAYLEDGAYALFAAYGWPLTRMLAVDGALRVSRLDCEYLSDALLGDQLTVRSWVLSTGGFDAGTDRPPITATLVQTIVRHDGTAVLRAHSEWVWRRRPAVVGAVPPP